jgi:hypothetical protein
MTCDDLDALVVELVGADDAADPRRLAAIAWQLYGMAGLAQAEIDRMHGTLRSTRSASPGQPARGRLCDPVNDSARAGTCSPLIAGPLQHSSSS